MTLQIVTLLRFGELAWRVSRQQLTLRFLVLLNFGEYAECFLSLQLVLQNAFCFCVDIILVLLTCLTETQHNRTHLEYAFGNDK